MTYNYDNGLPALLGPFLERKICRSLEAFAKLFPFDPMGITNYRWTDMRQVNRQKAAHSHCWGVVYGLRDMAKLGVMMLHKPKSEYLYGFYWPLNKDLGHNNRCEDAYPVIGQGKQSFVSFRR